MNFFEVLIKKRGDIEETLSELKWSFSEYLEFRRGEEFDAQFRVAMEIIASRTFAVHRRYANAKMPEYELKLLDLDTKLSKTDATSAVSFVINIAKDPNEHDNGFYDEPAI
jgi:hypothetical protein